MQTIQHQLEWFRRQLFGQKSEKRPLAPHPAQMHLGELPIPDAPPEPPGKPVAGHTRRTPRTDFAQDKNDATLFFDEARVPVETITLANPELEGLSPDQYEVIGEKVSHRLAQRPGSYVILKYVRPLIKRRDTQTLHCPAAPAGVIDGCRADVSFLAGLLLGGLRARWPTLRVAGIGGPKMQALGFDAWWPSDKLAVRGYVEVLRHYREIAGIRRQLGDRLLGEVLIRPLPAAGDAP